jgi:hypothetical protein
LISTPCMWILRSNTLVISSKALWIWWCLKMMPYAFNGGLNHNHNWNLFFFFHLTSIHVAQNYQGH